MTVLFNIKATNLVLLIEQFQLVVNKAVFGALLFPQRPLLLQLWAPEGLYAVHTGAQLLVGQFQLLLKIAQLPLEVGVLGLKFAEEERRGLAAVVVIFGWRRGSVRAVVVPLEGLVAEGSRSRAVVSAGGGGAASLVGRRRWFIVAREVGAAPRGAAVHLGQAAARAAGPLLPAPLLPARRPLILAGVLA